MAGVLGWTLAALLVLVVLLEAVAAAAITLMISPWLALAVVAGVLVAGVLIARDAHGRSARRPRSRHG